MEYFSGVIAAMAIKFYQIVMLVISLNSTRHRNFRKIGLRLSWLNLEPKVMETGDYNPKTSYLMFKAFMILAYGFINILFSWVFVLYWICIMAWQFSKRSGMPQALKEFGWRINNIEMTKDQVIDEFTKVENLTPEKIETFKSEVEARLKNSPKFHDDSFNLSKAN